MSIPQNNKNMKINKDFIEELKEKLDIKEVIEYYTNQQFKNNKILCPLHNEKTASFIIYPTTNSFYCFGCNIGGDLIRFVELYKNLEFIEAVKIIANDFNLKTPSYSKKELKELRQKRKVIQTNKEIYKVALAYFQKELKEEQIDFLINNYGLTTKTIKKYKLGYCKAGLIKHLKSTGYSDQEIYNSGLATKDKKTGQIKDLFYNKIMIPYLKTGQPIYFTGRAINNNDKIKYLNLKHNNQYITNPLFIARLEGNEKLILTEGEFDSLATTELIIDYDIIALGKSGLSKTKKKELFKIIKRYQDVIIINDQDENKAGIKGAIQTAKTILKGTGIISRIGELNKLPEQKSTDLADYNRNNKNLKPVIKESLEFIELLIKNIQKARNGREAIKETAELYPLLALIKEDYRAYYIDLIRRSISKVKGCSKSTLNKSTIKKAIEKRTFKINNQPIEEFDRLWFEFTQNGGVKFKPAILGKYFLKNNNYITLSGNIYQYKKGVYTNGGETDLRKILMDDDILADEWEVTRADSVVSYIKQATKEDPIKLFASNKYDHLVNVKNGMVDLNTIQYKENERPDLAKIELLKHQAKYKNFSQLKATFNPAVECQKVDQIINSILLDKKDPDPNKAKVFWEFIGWIIFSGEIELKKALLLVGSGDNGKSVLLNFLTELLGKSNIGAVGLYDIINNPYAASDLFGKIANLAGEMTNTIIKDIETFKKITGGDLIRADQKYKEPLEFKNKAKLIFALNTLPKVADYEEAFFNRLLIIRTPNTFTKNSPDYDPYILKKITTNKALSYGLNKAIEGFARLQANGLRFTDSKAINQELRDYQAQVNTAIPFINEVCNLKAGVVTSKSYLYEIYKVWAEQNGYGQMSKRKLTNRITQGFKLLKTKRVRFERLGNKRDQAWEGLELKAEAEAHFSKFIPRH